ncbi:MAG: hypothetical protein EZS28_048763, partial [Streblomastix strix]
MYAAPQAIYSVIVQSAQKGLSVVDLAAQTLKSETLSGVTGAAAVNISTSLSVSNLFVSFISSLPSLAAVLHEPHSNGGASHNIPKGSGGIPDYAPAVLAAQVVKTSESQTANIPALTPDIKPVLKPTDKQVALVPFTQQQTQISLNNLKPMSASVDGKVAQTDVLPAGWRLINNSAAPKQEYVASVGIPDNILNITHNAHTPLFDPLIAASFFLLPVIRNIKQLWAKPAAPKLGMVYEDASGAEKVLPVSVIVNRDNGKRVNVDGYSRVALGKDGIINLKNGGKEPKVFSHFYMKLLGGAPANKNFIYLIKTHVPGELTVK